MHHDRGVHAKRHATRRIWLREAMVISRRCGDSQVMPDMTNGNDVELIRRRAQAELAAGACPAEIRLGPGPSGWPLVAVLASGTEADIVLGEFDRLPLQDDSLESMAAVIANNVRALYDERRDAVPSTE
jgi:hypothetical protein